MSVDVEDWFQTASFKGVISRADWDGFPLRVERNVDLILNLLEARDVRCTFFILGWIAEKAPGVIRAIQSAGIHEIACHGYNHDCLYDLSPREFREDIRRSKGAIEEISGEKVAGYRAPNFSITDWAIDILQEEGFEYDSSFFPNPLHDRYGSLDDSVPRNIPVFEIRHGFSEYTMSRARFFGQYLPWAGGGYFRLLPYPIFRMGTARILDEFGVYNFYIHPWEFDPEQPRFNKGMKRTNYFRHYNNIDRTAKRFAALIRDFPFTSIAHHRRLGPSGFSVGRGPGRQSRSRWQSLSSLGSGNRPRVF